VSITRRIVIALLVLALAAAVLFGIVHGYEAWRGHVFNQGDTAGAARVQALWDKDKIARDKDTLRKVAEARADEQRMAADAAKGEANARRRAEDRAQAHALLLACLLLLLAACATTSPPSTGLPEPSASRTLPPVPASLRANGTKPSEREPFSARAARNIDSWQKTLTAPLPASSSASTPH
jgi:hypothetical protein